MAKIIKITPAINTPKTVNPFKNLNSTTTTNPFKYSNFEGNTLQFADVFEGFEPKKYNKLKMIATSVAGSMNKIKSYKESIANFVKRVTTKVTSAWDYAKNTNISELAAVKTFNDIMNTPVEIPGTKTVEALKAKMSAKLGFFDMDIVDLGKEISSKWEAMVEKLQPKKITADMSVSELEALWKAELAAVEVGGVA